MLLPHTLSVLIYWSHCRWVGQLAITCSFFIYASIGLTVSGYFGANVAGSCNVNWEVSSLLALCSTIHSTTVVLNITYRVFILGITS
jgi:hypothetical protein